MVVGRLRAGYQIASASVFALIVREKPVLGLGGVTGYGMPGLGLVTTGWRSV